MSMTLHSSQLSRLTENLTNDMPAAAAERLLHEFFVHIDQFRAELEQLSGLHFNGILPLSRETPTHYKWHMFSAPDKAYTIWLHEYKPHLIRSGGYAQSIHNHRYPMSALLLTGGYRCTMYTVARTAEQRTDISVASSRTVTAGSIYSMSAADFHSVTEIQDGTVSILVQGRPVRPYSISVDAASHRAARHVPIEERLDDLRSCLAGAGGGPVNEDH